MDEGERYADMQARVEELFKCSAWPEMHDGRSVMLVSHNGCLKVLRAHNTGRPGSTLEKDAVSCADADPLIWSPSVSPYGGD